MTKKRLNLRNVVAIAICLAGVTMFIECKKENSDLQGGLDGTELGNSKSIRLANPKDNLNSIKTNYKLTKIMFTPDDVPSWTTQSHTQGYSRYRDAGNNYDYHIFAYSNVTGHHGYLYITGKKTFTLKVPETEIRYEEVSGKEHTANPHFNHACGVQVLGDYLIVPVIPAYGGTIFYDATIIYLYDLTPLKDSDPSAPNGKEILRVAEVNGGSLSCVGIIDLPNGNYAMGLMADNNLDIYLSSNNKLWDATWNKTKTYQLKAQNGKNNYQGLGFFLGEDEEVYMLGGDNRDAEDWADLYKLTENKIWKNDGQLTTIKEIHLFANNASFSNACAIEICSKENLSYMQQTPIIMVE